MTADQPVDAVLDEVLRTRGGTAIYADVDLVVRWESGDIQILTADGNACLPVGHARDLIRRLTAALDDPPPICPRCCLAMAPDGCTHCPNGRCRP